MMNPLAQKLNDEIKQSSPEVLDMMSQLGKDVLSKEFYHNPPKQNVLHIMLLLVWQPKRR